MKAGEYRGQVQVPSKTSAPPITLYSTESDASKTVIVANQAEATAGSMSNSATLTVKAVRGFQMKNITVANDYAEVLVPGGESAVAMLLQSDQAQFENVRFLGNIGTLYVKSSSETIAARSYFRDCYVEGDQDFIVGRGTAIFDHSEIKSWRRGNRRASDRISEHAGVQPLRVPVRQLQVHRGDGRERRIARAPVGGAERHDGDARHGGGEDDRAQLDAGRAPAGAAPWSSMGARTTTPRIPAGTTPVVRLHLRRLLPGRRRPSPPSRSWRNTATRVPGAHQ